MDLDPSSLDSEYPSRQELLVDASETALQLISALRIQRESDIKRALLFFDATQSDFMIPDFISRNIAPDSIVHEIVLDATINRLTNKSEMSLRIDIAGSEDVYMCITVDESNSEEPASLLDINETEMPHLDPVSMIELNRFLASLFLKNKTGDYSAFDAMNVSSAQTAERLIEALQNVAAESVLDETYFLGETVGATTDSIRYTERDEVVQDATITVEHHAKASALELSFVKRTEDTEPDGDIDNLEFMMQNLEGARTFVQDVDGISTQVESTNDFLIVVRDFLKEQSRRVFRPTVEHLGDGDVDVIDPTLSMNFEDRSDS